MAWGFMCSSQLTFLLQAIIKLVIIMQWIITVIHCLHNSIRPCSVSYCYDSVLLLATIQILYSPRSSSMCGTERWTPVLLYPVHP